MNAFLTKLVLTPLPNGRDWELDEDFKYVTDIGSGGDTLTVPAGFITDLASIPRVFWNIYPPFGQYTEAAVIHDYGYRTAGKYVDCDKTFTKAQVDGFFRDAMKLCGVGLFSRTLLWQAVVRFGHGSFKG